MAAGSSKPRRFGGIDRTPQEVARIIESFLAGTDDSWAWDDFTSIPINDPCLDEIRRRCERVYDDHARESWLMGQVPARERVGSDKNTWSINEAGIAMLRQLASELQRET